MNLASLVEMAAGKRGITVCGLVSEVGLSWARFNAFVNALNKTEPSLRTCARILKLHESCGVAAEPITFQIDGISLAVVRVNPVAGLRSQPLTPTLSQN